MLCCHLPLHGLLILVLLLGEAPTGHLVAPATDPSSPGHTHTRTIFAVEPQWVSRKITSLAIGSCRQGVSILSLAASHRRIFY